MDPEASQGRGDNAAHCSAPQSLVTLPDEAVRTAGSRVQATRASMQSGSALPKVSRAWSLLPEAICGTTGMPRRKRTAGVFLKVVAGSVIRMKVPPPPHCRGRRGASPMKVRQLEDICLTKHLRPPYQLCPRGSGKPFPTCRMFT